MTHAAALTIKGVALAHSITTARGTWKRRRGVLLRLTDDEGRVGLGEATPLPGYSPDDADASARAITSLAPRLPHGTLKIPADFDAALVGLPSARFALETALADLEAQRRGTSVAAVLAGGPALQDAPCSGLVDLGAADFEARARALVARGIETVKTKLGVLPRAEELARLATLRAALGPAVRLRLDANGAFDLEGARALLADVARFDPELVEEPTSGESLLTLGLCACPWAADESLQDTHIAERLLATPCAAFVVKPQLYGLRAARALALRAQAHGKAVVVTHMFDGPVALAVACELALSLPSPPLACGLDAHASLGLFGAAVVHQLRVPGRIRSHDPGLGVTFD